jgi:hypothetical protein
MRERIPDRVRYARALRAAGSRGLHTSEIRSSRLSGNPSQRAADLEERGFRIRIRPEHLGGRNGARHTLIHDAGDAAAWLTESQLAAGGGADQSPASPRAASARAGRARRPTTASLSSPAAPPDLVWLRDWDGEWRELTEDEYRRSRQLEREAA